MGVRRRLAVIAVGATVVAGCGHAMSSFGPALVAQGCRAGHGITAHATTKSYIFQLDIGPVEAMYTQAQADASHPSEGEVILRGQMTAVSTSGYKLELHICSNAGGAVVQNADPTITVVNDATKNEPQNIQVAVMQPVGADVGELHYGNNVVLSGGSNTVIVSLNGETSTLHVQIPADGTGTTVFSPVTDMHGM